MTDTTKKRHKKTVCVDLNGVLDTYDGWVSAEHMHPPAPGAKDFLLDLSDHGYEAVILSSRDPAAVEKWMSEHFGLKGEIWAYATSTKVPAMAYVDDRAVHFDGDYATALRGVLELKTHWELAKSSKKAFLDRGKRVLAVAPDLTNAQVRLILAETGYDPAIPDTVLDSAREEVRGALLQ
jgi:hypothetical protein